jgi:hypothetical protein
MTKRNDKCREGVQMKAFAIKVKNLAVRVLNIILVTEYPGLNQRPSDWWNYID